MTDVDRDELPPDQDRGTWGRFGRIVGRDAKLPLRDAATPAMVDRVWFRLEEQLQPSRRSARSAGLVWGLAGSLATFTLGVLVGRGVPADRVPVTEPIVVEVPAAAASVSSAAPAVTGDQPASIPPPKRKALPKHPAVTRGVSVATAAPEESLVPQSDEVPAEPPEQEAPAKAVQPPRWQQWAHGGEYDAALFELSQVGGFESVLQGANSEQLMLLADVARATGQTRRAIVALKRIMEEFPNDPLAPLATYSLGNLLDRVGDREAAAQAFSAYQRLSPQGDFAEDALVRRIRSAVERGETEQGRQLAAQYETSFPGGHRGAEVAEWLETLAAHSGAMDAGVPLVEEQRGSGEDSPAVEEDL
jgi:TolA-binding protein